MIRVEHIKKKYGARTILEDITFEARPGEQIAIIGRNGCGKTTLMQILSGMIAPSAGSIFYFGKEAGKKHSLFTKYCGYVPQENPLIYELNVQDNISLWSGKRGKPSSELCDFFELEEILKAPVYKLSGGMKRRVCIACALSQLQPVLLMDEPTAALDMYYQESIHQWMEKYLAMNGIIILVTHDVHEISLSHRVYRIEEGRIHTEKGGKTNEIRPYDRRTY